MKARIITRDKKTIIEIPDEAVKLYSIPTDQETTCRITENGKYVTFCCNIKIK